MEQNESGKWTTVNRYTRKVTSGISKSGVQKHHVNLPEEYFQAVCDELGGECGNSVLLVQLKNEKTGAHLIVLTGLDGYGQLVHDLNLELVL
jgi:hypothetical protein